MINILTIQEFIYLSDTYKEVYLLALSDVAMLLPEYTKVIDQFLLELCSLPSVKNSKELDDKFSDVLELAAHAIEDKYGTYEDNVNLSNLLKDVKFNA
jgi:hypothetical protein